MILVQNQEKKRGKELKHDNLQWCDTCVIVIVGALEFHYKVIFIVDKQLNQFLWQETTGGNYHNVSRFVSSASDGNP